MNKCLSNGHRVIHYSFFIHIKALFGAYALSEKHTYTRKKKH